jgi:hypothetical protein
MFSRTQNDDGTSSTRCLYCFRIVAPHAESPAELDSLERRHICPEKALAQLRFQQLVVLKNRQSR